MADSAELAFVKSHLSILGSAPVTYPDDYQQVPSNQLKKVPVIPVRNKLRLYHYFAYGFQARPSPAT